METFAKMPPSHSLFSSEIFPWNLIIALSIGLLGALWIYWRSEVQRKKDASLEANFAARFEAQAIEQAARVQLNVQAEELKLGRPLNFQEMFYIQAEVTLPSVSFAEIKDKTQQAMDGIQKI